MRLATNSQNHQRILLPVLPSHRLLRSRARFAQKSKSRCRIPKNHRPIRFRMNAFFHCKKIKTTISPSSSKQFFHHQTPFFWGDIIEFADVQGVICSLVSLLVRGGVLGSLLLVYGLGCCCLSSCIQKRLLKRGRDFLSGGGTFWRFWGIEASALCAIRAGEPAEFWSRSRPASHCEPNLSQPCWSRLAAFGFLFHPLRKK